MLGGLDVTSSLHSHFQVALSRTAFRRYKAYILNDGWLVGDDEYRDVRRNQRRYA